MQTISVFECPVGHQFAMGTDQDVDEDDLVCPICEAKVEDLTGNTLEEVDDDEGDGEEENDDDDFE